MLIDTLRQSESPSAKGFVKWWDEDELYAFDDNDWEDRVESHLDAFLAGMQYSADQLNTELGKGDGRHEVVEKEKA